MSRFLNSLTCAYRFASNIVLKIAFGVDLTHDEDSSIQVATGLANRVLAEGGSPGATLVDNFPFLRKFPSWLVRSQALKHARKWGWVIRQLHDTPFSASKRHFVIILASFGNSYADLPDRKMGACVLILSFTLF